MKTVSGREFARLLQRNGWLLLRIKGSHHIFCRPDGSGRLIVPVHANTDLKPGLLKALMRDSGLTEADL